jgi:hypothetical protein
MGYIDLIILKVLITFISYGIFLNLWDLDHFLELFLKKSRGDSIAYISATPQPNTANIRIFLFILELSTELNLISLFLRHR